MSLDNIQYLSPLALITSQAAFGAFSGSMKIIFILFRLLAAIWLLAFAGAVVGGSVGLMLVGLDLLDFHHVYWLAESGAAVLVVWGFSATGSCSSDDRCEAPAIKARSIELFDVDFLIETRMSCGIWHE